MEKSRIAIKIRQGSIHQALRTYAAATKSLQSCPTLCDPIDGSPPGSPIPGIPQARTLEWVAISFSNAWKWKVKVKSLNHVRLFTTPWTAAYQAPLSMGLSRQEYWSGVPSPSPRTYGDLKFYELIICNWKPGVITCVGQSMKTFFIYNVAELQHRL